jgi:hypothetical protein
MRIHRKHARHLWGVLPAPTWWSAAPATGAVIFHESLRTAREITAEAGDRSANGHQSSQAA